MEIRKFGDPSRLLILGNGFDLQAGLDSKFHDYVENGLDRNAKTILVKSYIDFDQVITVQSPSNNPIYLQIDEDLLSSSLEALTHFIISNKFSFWDYLLIINQSEQINWEDVENTILTFFKDDIDEIKRILGDISTGRSMRLNNSSKYYIFLTLLMVRISNRSVLVSDETLYNFLYQELLKFENNFKTYLIANVTDHSEHLDNSKLLMYQLSNKERLNILTFNYTRPFENLPNVEVTRNVHGSLQSDCIIGIDQNSIDNNNKYQYRFTKTYRIMQLASDRQEKHILNKNIKSIVFYGHSLAAADYSYFQSIFDFYSIYGSDVTLVFYYSVYDENKKEQIIKTQFDSIRKLLMNYGDTLDNKDHGKNLLHKLLLEDRLIIKELNY